MKKCPDKQLLYSIDDPELNIDDRVALESHLQACPRCREEVAAVRSAEEAFKADVNGIFRSGEIRKRAMNEIIKNHSIEAERHKKAKYMWLWVLAPGLAIVLLAALFHAVVPRQSTHQRLVTCQAHSDNAMVNEKIYEFGRMVELQHLPVELNGSFIFTSAGQQAWSFEHCGVSTLVKAEQQAVEFVKASATFNLLSGDPVTVKIDGSNLVIGELKPVDRVTATSALETIIVPAVASEPADIIGDIEPDQVMPVELPVSSLTAEAPENQLPASETAPHEELVNPFLDKPLLINGN